MELFFKSLDSCYDQYLDPITGGIIATGVGSLLGGLFSSSGQSSANKTNMQIAEKTFQHDKEMWELEKEYNTPSNQMARYREAGLNPHMMYGSVTPGNASNAPTYKSPHVENALQPLGSAVSAGAMSVGNMLFQQKMMDANVTKATADAELSLARAREAGANVSLTNQKTLTEMENTIFVMEKAFEAKFKNNLNKELKDIIVAIENQKLRNMTLQEKDMYSQITAREVDNALKRTKITSEEFYRTLESMKFGLQKKVSEANILFQKGQISHMNMQDAISAYRTVNEIDKWTREYLLDQSKLTLENNKYKFDKYYKTQNLRIHNADVNAKHMWNGMNYFKFW